MKITELSIERFGIWSEVRLDALSPGLNVFYGPNETGKTTLMQFVRSVLYGFSPERRRRYLPPVGGYPAGGTLVVAERDQRYALEREIDRDGYQSELKIRSLTEDELSGETLRQTLAGVDEALFNNVFVLGLHDLQQLGALTDTRASELLFRIAAGIDRVSLHEVMTELAESRNRLLAADDRPCEVMHLLAQTRRLRGEIAELAESTKQYGQLVAQERETASELRQTHAARQAAQEALERLRLAHSVLPHWQRRAALDEQIAALGEVTQVPSDALSQIEALDRDRAEQRRRWLRFRARRQMLAAQLEAIEVNEQLWQQAARIEALCDQRDWITSLEAQADEVAQEVDALATRLDAERRRAGIRVDGQGHPVGRKRLFELRQLALEVRNARRKLKELDQRGQQHVESLAALDSQVAGGLTGRDEASLSEALERQGEVVTQLRHRLDLDERAEQYGRQLKDLEAQHLELLERQVIPGWVIGTVGGFFAMGVCLLLAGLVLPLPMSGALSLGLAAIGAVGAAAAAAAKYFMEQSNHRKLERCEKQLSVLAVQVRQNREERAELDRQLPRSAGPLTMRLQTAEAELARLEELIPLNARRETLLRDQAAQQRTRDELQQQLTALRQAWHAALEQAGLPADFAPAQLKTLRRSNLQIERFRQQLAQKQQELEQRQRAIAQFAERVAPLLAACDIPVSSKRLTEQLHQLGGTLAALRERAGRRDAVRKEYDVLGRRLYKLRRLLEQLRSRRRELLRASGVEHEEELRRAQVRWQQLTELQTQRGAAEQEIETLLTGRYTEAELEPWIGEVSDHVHYETRCADCSATIERASQRADELARRQGELNERIKTLVADRRLPNKQIDLAMTEERLKQAVERWQVLALSWSVLDKLRREYELDRQPETLRLASQFFQRLTKERYCRVWTPLGETTLMVTDQQGHALPVEVLSRGTREQLYLALRLALAQSFAKRGMELPLVLDDLLVNFDLERARSAALVLRDFAAAGHQVLLFTCHEHLLRLFRSLGITVRALPGVVLEAETPVAIEAPAAVEVSPSAATPAFSPVPILAEVRPRKRAGREEAVVEERRIPKRRERIVERPRLPAAPDVSWDAEDFAGEFAERRIGLSAEAVAVVDSEADRDEAA